MCSGMSSTRSTVAFSSFPASSPVIASSGTEPRLRDRRAEERQRFVEVEALDRLPDRIEARGAERRAKRARVRGHDLLGREIAFAEPGRELLDGRPHRGEI